MWIALAMVIVAIFMVLKRGEYYISKTDEFNVGVFFKVLARRFAIGFTAALLLTFITDSVVVINAGHRGVVFDSIKGVKPNVLTEGMNFITPFVQSVTVFNVQIQNHESEAAAASKDLQDVKTKVVLNFRPIPDKIFDIYKNVGPDYVAKVVHPAIQEAVKAVAAKYTAEELIIKREDVKTNITNLLRQHISTINLELIETYITDFEFSKEFTASIEQKQVAEQNALKSKRDLDRIKIEAEQKIATARAEAESLRMQKEAITPLMVQLRTVEVQSKAIEKWNGQLPDVMMGGTMPFIDMSKYTNKHQGE